MSRKTIGVSILVIVIVALGIGAYAVAHNNTTSNASGSAYGQPSTQAKNDNPKSQQSSAQMIGSVFVVKSDPSLGKYLATPSGKPLYTFGGDSTGTSNCIGSCLTEWPAYESTGTTTNLPTNVGTIKRADDGAMQISYKGRPLYTFVDDTSGQITGNNVGNFHLAIL